MTDNELVQRIAHGSHRAFRALFERHYSPLCAFAFGICGDEYEAEDLVQGFFLEIWDRRASLTIRYTFKAYAFRAVHNRALNQRQRGNTHSMESWSDELDELPDLSPSSEEREEAEATLERLELAIEALPDKCRRVFSLIYFEGLPYAKTAELLGLSLNTVKVQMSRAYKRIRKQVII